MNALNDNGRREILKGAGLMCSAMLIIPFMNATAKWLGGQFPIVEVVWARYAGHLLFMLVLFLPRRGFSLFRSVDPKLQLIRSALLLTSTCCYFTALKFLPLPTAASISFTSPVIVVLLAIPMLGERVGLKRWFAVLLGFSGMLVIIRPGIEGTHWSGLLVLVSASCFALYQILTRRIAGRDSAETTITYTAVVGTVVLSFIVPFDFQLPDSSLQWLLICVIGFIAAIGHYLIVLAYQFAPASVLSPMNYVQLIGATTLSIVLFNQVPDSITWLGAAMIVAASAYVTLVPQRPGS